MFFSRVSNHLRQNPSRLQRIQLLIVLLALVLAICTDQYTKFIAQEYLVHANPLSFFSGILQFSYVENSSGFLGVVKDLPESIQFFFLNICVSALLLYCLYYLFLKKNRTTFHATALAAITGGGISNLLDRIIHNGFVIDFIQIGIAPIQTGIFNLADIYILVGSFFLGFLLLSSDYGQS